MALATATNWLSNFIVSSLFLTTLEIPGGNVFTFIILAAFAILAFLFVYFLLPETKGKEIHENV